MNSLSAQEEKLSEALRKLSFNWECAKAVWNDVAREEFEKNYWMEFESSTTASIENMHELIAMISRAEREMP